MLKGQTLVFDRVRNVHVFHCIASRLDQFEALPYGKQFVFLPTL